MLNCLTLAGSATPTTSLVSADSDAGSIAFYNAPTPAPSSSAPSASASSVASVTGYPGEGAMSVSMGLIRGAQRSDASTSYRKGMDLLIQQYGRLNWKGCWANLNQFN